MRTDGFDADVQVAGDQRVRETGGDVNRNDWERERTEAEMWWCGDEDCNCVQPQIWRVSPNREAGYPWVRKTTIWEGTFVSLYFGWPEGVTYKTLEDELRAACQEYGIEYAEKAQG